MITLTAYWMHFKNGVSFSCCMMKPDVEAPEFIERASRPDPFETVHNNSPVRGLQGDESSDHGDTDRITFHYEHLIRHASNDADRQSPIIKERQRVGNTQRD